MYLEYTFNTGEVILNIDMYLTRVMHNGCYEGKFFCCSGDTY